MDTIVMSLVRTNSNFTDQVSQKKKQKQKQKKTITNLTTTTATTTTLLHGQKNIKLT